MKNSFQRVVDAMLCVGLAAALFLVGISRILHPDKPTMVFGYFPAAVMSGSMLPALQVYSFAIVKDCAAADVAEGDIIVYRDDSRGMNIIHRVYETDKNGGEAVLRTWGDNNPAPDGMETTDGNLIGKVVLVANWTAPIVQKLVPVGTALPQGVVSLLVSLVFVLPFLLAICALYGVAGIISRAARAK